MYTHMYTHISLLTQVLYTYMYTHIFLLTYGLYLHVYPLISTDTWLIPTCITTYLY